MNYATHFLDPSATTNDGKWVRMLCGRVKNSRIEKIMTSDDPDKVTCTKCLGFHDNPARILRKYGHVTLIEPYGITLMHGWGFTIDIIAFTTTSDLCGWRYMMRQGDHIYLGSFVALSYKEAIRQIIILIQNQLLCKNS